MISAAHKTLAATLMLVLTGGWLMGCATPARKLDADALWESAEMRQPSTMRSVDRITRQQDDYTTVTRIARDAELRGQAFLRLAELDMALGNYESAHHRLEQALRSGLPHESRRQALLMLGDLFERYLSEPGKAIVVYRQILTEYPGTFESELAMLRLKGLSDEQ
jgi:hypothetical protein